MTSTTLVIVPTKDRAEAINVLIQSLLCQDAEFDLFIADMSTNPNYLSDNWYFRVSLERLRHTGKNYFVQKVDGANQLCGDQAGLEYAKKYGYDLCLILDDDMTLEKCYIRNGQDYMDNHLDCGILVGYTLLPWQSLKEQTQPESSVGHPDFSGKLSELEKGGYYHCTLLAYEESGIRDYEVVFGAFFFRTADALAVGGFPTYLSKYGFRGEMMLQLAIARLGNKQTLNPYMRTWHYSASWGGLKLIQGEEKKRCQEADKALFYRFLERGTADTQGLL